MSARTDNGLELAESFCLLKKVTSLATHPQLVTSLATHPQLVTSLATHPQLALKKKTKQKTELQIATGICIVKRE
jgi:hypothetical protein